MQFDEKLKKFAMAGYIVPDRSLIKTPAQVEGIKKSSVINRACLDNVGKAIRAGMSTQEIDDMRAIPRASVHPSMMRSATGSRMRTSS